MLSGTSQKSAFLNLKDVQNLNFFFFRHWEQAKHTQKRTLWNTGNDCENRENLF